MKKETLDCAEIRGGFRSGRAPEGAAVDEHLRSCESCRALFEGGGELGQILAAAVVPPADPGDLFQALDRQLAREVGWRAKLRALPTRQRVGLLVGAALLLLCLELTFRGRPDLPILRTAQGAGSYSVPVFWLVSLVLLGGLALGAWRLSRSLSTPLAAAATERFTPLLLLALPAFSAMLVPLGAPAAGAPASQWERPYACFGYGAALVVPFLLLALLLERRDRIPVSVLVSTGALTGVAANLLLHGHCSSTHWGHLLVGHATIGVAWACTLALFARRFQRSD